MRSRNGQHRYNDRRMKEKARKSNRHMTTHLAYIDKYHFGVPCCAVLCTVHVCVCVCLGSLFTCIQNQIHIAAVCSPYGNAANVAAVATETAANSTSTDNSNYENHPTKQQSDYNNNNNKL